ncbi:MAG: hypothetical protein GY798_06425, partial [Hyphomicrobiales bacterium]|nr:hypothetical protein [Hyphomicrobiales bacterium]
TRKTYAKTLLTELESGGPTDAISLRRQLFVRGKSTDALLALIGLHNTTGCYLPANAIMETARDHFQADQNGIPKAELDRSVVAMAQCWAEDITVLLEEPELQPFTGPVRATETP